MAPRGPTIAIVPEHTSPRLRMNCLRYLSSNSPHVSLNSQKTICHRGHRVRRERE